MSETTLEIRNRSRVQFAQLVLLLVNIIQGLSLQSLVQHLLGIELAVGSIPVFLRLIACFLIIWLITFEYAVVYVSVWSALNGVRDICLILLLGICEYAAIVEVPNPSAWLGWIIALATLGIACFVNSNMHMDILLMDLPHDHIFTHTKKVNYVNMAILGSYISLLIVLLATRYAVPSWVTVLDTAAAVAVISYTAVPLYKDSRFLNRLLSSAERVGES